MTDEHRANPLEDAFRLARSGNPEAFAEWMGMAEIPLRRSLRRFARAVDVEVVVQETLLRMWLLANDPQWVLEGNSASLKFAFRVARNVALEEIRRFRQDRFVNMNTLDSLPEGCVEPELPDPALGRGQSTTASNGSRSSPGGHCQPACVTAACRIRRLQGAWG